VAPLKDLLVNPSGSPYPLIANKTLKLVAWHIIFRKGLEAEEISSKAATLISNSRRTSSTNNYKSAWRKWHSWCCKRQADSFKAPLTLVLDFLADLFEKGYKQLL